MLKFIKSEDYREYQELIQLKPEYSEALFLDTTENRLWINGAPLDIRVELLDERDDNLLSKRVYKFTEPKDENKFITIDEAVIPSIVDGEIVLRNMETGEDVKYQDGLMPVEDKMLIAAMADAFGVSLEYHYYASVNHVRSAVADHDFETLTDVDIYRDGDTWKYDYEAFTYIGKDPLGEDHEYTYPAGSREVDSDLVRVKSVTIKVKPQDVTLFDGGDRPDTQQTLVPHGGIPAGTTVAQLEEMTNSEIIANVLFQSAHPVKIKDAQAFVKYKESYAPDGIIPIGHEYPRIGDFEVVFTPETWQLFTDTTNEPVGDPIYVQVFDHVEYWLLDKQHPTEIPHRPYDPDNDLYNLEKDAEYYADHVDNYKVEYGDKSEYWAEIFYTAGEAPKDSNGKTTHIVDGEEVPYATPTDGSIKSNILLYNNQNAVYDEDEQLIWEDPIVTAWQIYSNASYATGIDFWDDRFREPGSFIGNDERIAAPVYAQKDYVAYLKWPSVLHENDKMYVYIPVDFKPAFIYGANDFTPNRYDIELDFYAVLDENDEMAVTVIKNELGYDGEYNIYEISRQTGITSAKVVVAEKE